MTAGKCKKIVDESTEEIKTEVATKTDSLGEQIKKGFDSVFSFFNLKKKENVEVEDLPDDYYTESNGMIMPKFVDTVEEETSTEPELY